MRYKVGASLGSLVLFTAAVFASGPYLPPRNGPSPAARGGDTAYRVGQAIFNGDTRLGAGTTCVGCHRGTQSLKADKLRAKSSALLETQVEKCVRLLDRTNGVADRSQLQALMSFLKGRYRL